MNDTTSNDPGGKRPNPVLDTIGLGAWMDTVDIGTGAPIQAHYLTGGSQNEIFEIRRGDFHGALRKPPPGAPDSRNGGILREWRIIEALAGTDVPHAHGYAVCTDPSVLGGTFYLMGFVDGWSPMGEAFPEPFRSTVETQAGLAFEVVRGVACMSRVDWQAKGLGDLGRPDGYHDRQVERWTRFYDRVKTREIPGFTETTAWLDAHRPLDFVPGLMHGDYQFANVMFRHDAPAQLAAIIDWEMGTIGDPKIDLAWAVQMWPDQGKAHNANNYIDLTHMPTRDELVEYFVRESGRQCDDIDYYIVLARWKLAIVLEQSYKYVTQSDTDDDTLARFGPLILDLMGRAADLAHTTDLPKAKKPHG
ncbi:MAG: phosphotransferase family protein [Ilumatobacteraceae bacterium]|nr:phosphotransferase family protein [Ilumatobacteraceae bacterium]